MYNKILFSENYIIKENTTISGEGLYVADFETSNVNNIDNDVFVYATGLMNVNDDSNICIHNNNIHDFINNISNLPEIESKIYFHNLSFDTVFCLLELFEKGFSQIRNKYKQRRDGGLEFTKGKKTIKVNKEVSKANKNDDVKYLKRPFSYNIVFNAGSFYRVDLYFDFVEYKDNNNRKKTKLRKVSLMDSYKIVPSSLKKLAKDFLNYDMGKDGIDHNIIRPINYNLTESEKEYLYEDVRVLKDFIKLVLIDGVEVTENYKIHFDKMTTASQSLNEYKNIMFDMYNNNNYTHVQAFKDGFKDVDKFGNTNTSINKDMLFMSVFPQLHPNVDCYLRQSYFGGITWKNETLINKLEKDNIKLKGLVYDVNSLYPSVMRTKLLPYGTPKYFEGCYNSIADFIKKDYPLYIQRIRVKRFEIKKNKMPNVQIRESENFNSTDYITDKYTITLDLSTLAGTDECGLFYYEFLFVRGVDTLFTNSKNNVDFSLSGHPANRFLLLIHSANFEPPKWFRGKIMYHVFVDRFAKGEGTVGVRNDVVINNDWAEGIPQYPEKRGDEFDNNMFFGGNLWGVAEKLDYLKSLGVGVIYLSPIFEAYSNHKYDTGNYLKIDEM